MDHTMFRPQIDGLSDSYRILAYNHRARTERWRERYDLVDLAGDCRQLLDSKGIAKCVLAGMSMGGFMAFEFARLYPDRLAGLILIDTKAGPYSADERGAVMRDYENANRDGFLPDALAALCVAQCFGATTIATQPELIGHWISKWRQLPARGVYNEVSSWTGKADNRPGLAEIRVPCLILHGDEDSIFPLSIAEEIQAGIPDADLCIVPGAGHTANLEVPDRSNDAIRSFLQTVERGR
jgi:pimeloyl-ACP methyl ester carboxylesterase